MVLLCLSNMCVASLFRAPRPVLVIVIKHNTSFNILYEFVLQFGIALPLQLTIEQEESDQSMITIQ